MTHLNTQQTMALHGISEAAYGAVKISNLAQNRISANNHPFAFDLTGHLHSF
ncbi:hypothetical protein [Pseudomonas cavernicola]|uniref:hypothetical protein n=1 Tax=Pseudomonas cavernicola TaxID=2320866 RepID=UPI001314F35E|nr:hypothetical protein [Pseudomonas cavernicola]